MKKLLLFAACAFASSFNSNAQQLVSTLAGQTATGSANGTGTAASFNNPFGVCVDLSGNVYVADKPNHLIRMITPAGIVTTLAGSGSSGSVNATGTAASFWNPQGVCADGSGNIYVADSYNNMIRKITPAGVVSTYAGTGAPGGTNGPAASASFLSPVAVACDLSGNIYVAEDSGQRIRMISSGGTVSTLAGSGSAGFANATGTLATFNYPSGICVDISGNVYVADQNNNAIRKITPAGVVSTFAGTGTVGNADGTGTLASFNSPVGVSTDLSGNIFVADYSNSRVRKITPAGVVTTITGFTGFGFQDGNTSVAQINHASGIACYTNGTLYLADRFNNRIRKIENCTAPSAPSAANATVCANAASLTASGSGTLSWFTASTGGTAFATGTTVVLSPTTTSGTYTYYVEAATDCTVSTSRTPMTVSVTGTPTVPTATAVNPYVAAYTSCTLHATGTGTINWYTVATGGTAVATGTVYITPSLMAGFYTYYAESANDCTVSARAAVTATAINTIGIDELQNKTQAVVVYPNPGNGLLTIAAISNLSKAISVMDVSGRVVLDTNSSDATTRLDLSAFADGIYYVKVRTAESSDVIRLIKQ